MLVPLYRTPPPTRDSDQLEGPPWDLPTPMLPTRSTEMASVNAPEPSVELTAGLVNTVESLTLTTDDHPLHLQYATETDSTRTTDRSSIVAPQNITNSGEQEQDEGQQSHSDIDYDEDSDEDDDDLRHALAVDLLAFEAQYSDQPLYTRDVLLEVAREKARLIAELAKPKAERTLKFLAHRSFKVWNAQTSTPKQDGDPRNVFVEFLTLVEFHPEFQRRCGNDDPKVQTLRDYNPEKKAAGRFWLQVQYLLKQYYQSPNTMHLDNRSMRIWRAHLDRTQSLWRKSLARIKLCSAIQTAVSNGLHIKKIVCFGLGTLSLDPAFYESWLQHLAVFTIANFLRQHYHETDPEHPPIEVKLQDPSYVGKDRALLSEKCPGSIRFMEDPDALLTVDVDTLVVTAFLPLGVPLMQILADLSGRDLRSGPAAIICDIMDLDPERQAYASRDRSSPAVAKFLLNGYDRKSGGFRDHHLEPDLSKDTYRVASEGKERRYWLNVMDMWTRK
jgi:hypothetical protein